MAEQVGNMVELKKTKSTQPRSETCWDTLYFILSFLTSYVICIFRVQNNSIHDNGSNAETDASTAILSIRTSLRGRIRYSTDLGLNSNEET